MTVAIGHRLALRHTVDVAAGLALICTLALHWASSGAGSSLSGRDLSGFLFDRGHTAGGLALFAPALVGCAVILTSAWPGRWVLAVRGLIAAALAVALIVVGTSGPLAFERWGAGPVAALAGVVVILAAETGRWLSSGEGDR